MRAAAAVEMEGITESQKTEARQEANLPPCWSSDFSQSLLPLDETNYLQRAREPPAGGTRNPVSLPKTRAGRPGGGLAGAFSSYNPSPASFCLSS